MKDKIAFGAHPSEKDKRDLVDHELAMAMPYPAQYSIDMGPVPVFYQGTLGICTSAALTASIIEWLYWKKTGVYTKLSVAFLYIVTKRYVDGNTNEGSSLRSALKAALKYGVCTEAMFPTDIDIAHNVFVSKDIPQAAFDEALKYKIGGYVSIPVDQSLIAAAMYKYGPLYARFEVSSKWFTPSWLEKDISPLVAGTPVISGHATALTSYDLSTPSMPFWLKNSWSDEWFRLGYGMFDFKDYKPTEVWAVTLDTVDHLSPVPTFLDVVQKQFLNILRTIGFIK